MSPLTPPVKGLRGSDRYEVFTLGPVDSPHTRERMT